ncbi:hypothetical protein EUGRSUZ_L01462 [Eucalyptus grandis]|uniref:Uncharacterized protein n=1 Tax=Eucalyptus grandis TaxID=71139 RepID=A0A058ZU61_EUCGR|nr:hypothetical protein EUGRSUZ_L01462 [Eucalyptus grandis]
MLPQPSLRSLARSFARTSKPNYQFLPRRLRTKASHTSKSILPDLNTRSLAHQFENTTTRTSSRPDAFLTPQHFHYTLALRHTFFRSAISTVPLDTPPENPNKKRSWKPNRSKLAAPFLNPARRWLYEISPRVFR